MDNTKWHVLSVKEVEQKLSTSLQKGLSRDEAHRRLEKYGPNELEQKGRKTVLSMFLDQFKDFMVIVLLVAAVISGF